MSNQQWNSGEASQWGKPTPDASADAPHDDAADPADPQVSAPLPRSAQPSASEASGQPSSAQSASTWETNQWAPPQQPAPTQTWGAAPQQPGWGQRPDSAWGSEATWGQGSQQAPAWPQAEQQQSWQRGGQQPDQDAWSQSRPQQPQQEWGQTGQQHPQQGWQPSSWGTNATSQPSAPGAWGHPDPQATSSQQTNWAQPNAQTTGPQQASWDHQQGWPTQQAWTPPAEQSDPKPSPFELGVTKLSLPTSAGLIFTIGSAALVVEWLFGFISVLTSGNEFISPSGWSILQSLVGGLAGVLVKVLVLRVLVEVGVAATRLLARSDESAAKSTETPSGEDSPA